MMIFSMAKFVLHRQPDSQISPWDFSYSKHTDF